MSSIIQLRRRQTTDHNVWPPNGELGCKMLAELTWTDTRQAGGFPHVGVLLFFLHCLLLKCILFPAGGGAVCLSRWSPDNDRLEDYVCNL